MREPKSIKIGNLTLEEIIEDHQHWLEKDCEGWERMRADLRYANLRSADLCNADLRGVNLRKANLCDANLFGANLYDADLRGTILRGANLCYANLCYANLYYADLRGTNLYGADLRYAKGKHIEYRKGKILTESIIGYKKCIGDIIVTLEIPRGAIVFSINGDKCRTNKAKVISIDGADRAYSTYDYMSYYVGDEFTVYDFDCEYNAECATGIHFFMKREESENY